MVAPAYPMHLVAGLLQENPAACLGTLVGYGFRFVAGGEGSFSTSA